MYIAYNYSDVISLREFGGGSGPILMQDVQCLGNEAYLLFCSSSRENYCFHYEDAGVRCLGGKYVYHY